jgi:hypothetical protein
MGGGHHGEDLSAEVAQDGSERARAVGGWMCVRAATVVRGESRTLVRKDDGDYAAWW